MLRLRRPSEVAVRSLIERQSRLGFSYPDVGATGTRACATPPPGYAVDHERVRLGAGEADFERACAALRRWEMFRMPGVELCWPDAPIEVETVVAVLARLGPLWSLNCCRIVHRLESEEGVERFGFSYGTLPEHGVRGEERFGVEWLRADESVWWERLAISKPGGLLARLARARTRRFQHRFGERSARAMTAATKRSGPPRAPGFSA